MLLFTFLFTLFAHHPQLQNADSMLVIKEINIIGNKKTRSNIILRELDLLVGDSIKKENLEAYFWTSRTKN